MSQGRVKPVATDSDFQKELIAAGNTLIVVDFFATWCGPCKTIAPKVAQLSEKYTNVIFLKVDVDICRNTARRYEVSSMPTFLFFKNREKLHQVRGADEQALEAGILQQLKSSGEGGGGGAGGEEVAGSVASVPGQMNLNSVIDRTGSECLNESDSHPFTNALSGGKVHLESDCDEQLIIAISFHMPVKLHSLQIVGPPDGRSPKTVRIFINQLHTIDFDTAEQRKAVQEFVLGEEEIKEDSVLPLQFVKFQNVQNLTLFIKDNQGGGETTVINYLGLFGTPLEAPSMKDFKRVSGEKGERHF